MGNFLSNLLTKSLLKVILIARTIELIESNFGKKKKTLRLK